jgi:hypothetical protein
MAQALVLIGGIGIDGLLIAHNCCSEGCVVVTPPHRLGWVSKIPLPRLAIALTGPSAQWPGILNRLLLPLLFGSTLILMPAVAAAELTCRQAHESVPQSAAAGGWGRSDSSCLSCRAAWQLLGGSRSIKGL